MKYPQHIYDPIRFEVACSIISHELKKLFPDLTETEFAKVKDQIYEWPVNPQKFLISAEPRDFWDGVEGIMTGFRLKSVVRFITAENVSWSKEFIDPKECFFVSELFVNDIAIPMIGKKGKDVLSWLQENNLVDAVKQKAENKFDKNLKRVTDPIYGKKDKDGNYHAFDGNGRIMYALVNEINKIEGYFGELKDSQPENFWVNTMTILDLGRFNKISALSTDAYLNLLSTIFKHSESARIEYIERSTDPQEIEEKVMEIINKIDS